jgi:hypothetical protein
MDKNGELEAYWRGHVGAWRARGETQRAYCDQHGLKRHSLSYWHRRLGGLEAPLSGVMPLTLIPATVVSEGGASAPCLSLASPGGWRLDFASLPPAGWVAELWGDGV